MRRMSSLGKIVVENSIEELIKNNSESEDVIYEKIYDFIRHLDKKYKKRKDKYIPKGCTKRVIEDAEGYYGPGNLTNAREEE